ncbi:MAG: 1-(5-phosphoribosyl)-5-[(5-phosphoribosylamino)methylideneamino]imidazole-4-carboxamide isomerase [Rickettsiales bacterium]
MRLYPAIDLKDGACVRLLKGDMNAATIYNPDPAAQARAFAEVGFDYLHVVDLNGAVSGARVNRPAVEAILSSTNVPVQLGGGIRDYAAIEAWLEAGITRVILGTAALKDPNLVKQAARDYPGRIVVGIDARGGMVATEGWVDTSEVRAVDLAKLFEDAGVAAIIYTDIARDGTLSGPNLDETAALAAAISIPVILSGGIGSMADLQAVKTRAAPGIEGIILGRALYEKTVDAHEALALMGRA